MIRLTVYYTLSPMRRALMEDEIMKITATYTIYSLDTREDTNAFAEFCRAEIANYFADEVAAGAELNIDVRVLDRVTGLRPDASVEMVGDNDDDDGPTGAELLARDKTAERARLYFDDCLWTKFCDQ